MSVPEVLELLAVLTATLFAGAAIYISIAEHPARLSCGTEIAAAQWAPSYRRATMMQAPLAIAAMATGIGRGLYGDEVWFVGAALIGSVVPFTLLVIAPTNRRLLDPRRDRASAETRALLNSWGRLHAVRSVLSFVASLLFIWASTRPS
jgi:hypothetical protein